MYFFKKIGRRGGRKVKKDDMDVVTSEHDFSKLFNAILLQLTQSWL